MPLNFTSDIMSLFDTKVANDPNYEAPGNFGLSATLAGAVGVDHATISVPGTYTTVPTATAGSGAATFQTRMKLLSGTTLAAAGTVYAPGNVLTLTGGTKTTTAQITVSTVKLVSATIAGGGTGYGNTQTFTVTVAGPASTTAQLSVTTNVSGVVTTINSISRAGSYTVLPTLAGNIVTGDNGTDHGSNLTLNLVFGINTFTVSRAGLYTILPSNPISVTGGTGTGATFTGSWAVDSLAVTNPGIYVNIAPTISFSSGAAAATAVLTTSQFSTDTEKVLMLIEIMRSYLAEANDTAQIKEIHEVLRKMMATMKFGGKTNFSAANQATNAVGAAMHYFANNAKHSAAV